MKIIDFKIKHPMIYKRILELQISSGNAPNDSLCLGDDTSTGNFWWSSTEEGFDVWDRVDSGDFDAWYEHHGLQPKTITIKRPKSIWQSFFEYLPSILRLIAIVFIIINIGNIFRQNNLWMVPVVLFGLGEITDLINKRKTEI